MRHDLKAEGARLRARPFEEPTALLALVEVAPIATSSRYAQRLRDVLLSTVGLASRVDFDSDAIALQTIPDWFALLTDGSEDISGDDPVGAQGKMLYFQERQEPPWGLEEWFYCFDPELRSWEWWDVTDAGNGQIHVWLDTKGEAHIPCEELWWLLYIAGAASVTPLALENAASWKRETSIPVL